MADWPPPMSGVLDSRRGDRSHIGPFVYGPKTRPQAGPDLGCDNSDTLRAYAAGAAGYDERTDRFVVFRRRIVDALDVGRDDVVVDVGCGTGLCLSLLQERVGAEGVIIAVDESVAMLDIAGARAEQFGWSNVTFILAPAAEVDLPVDADAALFPAVHDIVRCPDSVGNVLSQLRPGAHVARGGGKWAAPWLILLNACVAALQRPCVRSFEGFDHPWSVLAPYLLDLRITEMAFGTGYAATGRVPDRPPGPSPLGGASLRGFFVLAQLQAARGIRASVSGSLRNAPWSPSNS